MAALDDVLLEEPKLVVVFVDVVLFDAIRQPAHDEEVAVPNADATGSVKDLLNLVLGNER